MTMRLSRTLNLNSVTLWTLRISTRQPKSVNSNQTRIQRALNNSIVTRGSSILSLTMPVVTVMTTQTPIETSIKLTSTAVVANPAKIRAKVAKMFRIR